MYYAELTQNRTRPVRIGNLVYDALNQSLSSGTETIYLRSKLNQVLFYMISNTDHVVSRNELIEKIWEGNYYTGVKGVTHSVCKLRQTFASLGADQVMIRTFPKQGYALTVH